MDRRRELAVAAFVASGIALGATALPGAAVITASPPVGHSWQGRDIRLTRVGDPDSPRKALVVGSIHGDEPGGQRVTRLLSEGAVDVTGVDLWVIQSVNPDGVAAHRRTNAHGVDLNRNYSYRWRPRPRGPEYPGPAPFSEYESSVMRDVIEQEHFQVSVWFHQPWNAVLVPCRGPAPLQRSYAQIARMRTSCRGDGLRGTAIQWQNHTFPGTTAMVVELPAGRISNGLAYRNALAVASVTGRRPARLRTGRGLGPLSL